MSESESVSHKSRPSEPKHTGNLKPDEECVAAVVDVHLDVILSAPSGQRPAIQYGSVKFTQASSAALRDLVAVGDYRRSLALPKMLAEIA